jgi:hypothetical protein
MGERDDIVFDAVHALLLSEQMRLAADILETAALRHATEKKHLRGLKLGEIVWSPDTLRKVARDFEAQDERESKKTEQVEELTEAIYQNVPLGAGRSVLTKKAFQPLAEVLLEKGWTKS